jgi:uncharacterized protein involved in exopolysaccharide biosynthesis
MENKKQTSYNFNSVDLLIYIWNKRIIMLSVSFVAAVASIVISLTITPLFRASVIMFPASSASVAKELMIPNYSSRQGIHAFGEEDQAEQLLQVLHSEPIRSRIIEKYNLMEHYEINPDEKYPVTKLLEKYRSNINFRLTEFMSVEISVLDKDPVLAATIANDISDLVDTVYNSMKKERARTALRLVEKEYMESENNLVLLQDSLDRMGNQLKVDVKSGEDATDDFIRVFSEKGAPFLATYYLVKSEISLVAGLNLRYKEARVEAEQNLPYKFVVEKAIPPEKKAYPNKSLIVVVSTLASLLFALIILIVIDNIRERVALTKQE